MFLPSNITLKFGDSGDFVAELQRRLEMVGCFGSDAINGFYDGNTVSGVSRFQAMNGLSTDGVAGPETLRRLNGVIAGDSSAPNDSKAEEEALQHSEVAMVQTIMDQAPEQSFYAPPAEPAATTPALTPAETLAMFAPAPIPPVAEPAPQNRPSDVLAAMLMGEVNPPTPAPLAPREAPALAPLLATPTAPALPAEMLAATPPQPAPQTITAEPAATAPQAEEQKSLVGMARRFTNAMVQKLADYFEAKLPPSVLKEVQQIGVAMASQGMREAPMPTGPEIAPVRDQQIPGREGDQQIQRG